MESKRYCLIFKWIIIGVVLIFLTGCSSLTPKPVLSKKDKPEDSFGKKQSPMALAALSFSGQGQAYLKNKKPDEAIRVLERAVNLSPGNGENYYYLAEAWLMKGNAVQAREFNHLAKIYMKTDPEWKAKIESQKDRISKFK